MFSINAGGCGCVKRPLGKEEPMSWVQKEQKKRLVPFERSLFSGISRYLRTLSKFVLVPTSKDRCVRKLFRRFIVGSVRRVFRDENRFGSKIRILGLTMIL